MDPQKICNRLGLQAKRKWKVGEKRHTPAGTPLSGVYKETYCCFDLAPPRGWELERFIKRCNKDLDSHKRFLSHISSTGGSAEYFIGMFLDSNHGLEFSPEVLAQLTKLHIGLSLDLYGGTGQKSRKPKSPKRKQSV
jgi:hypothetical protein